MADCCEDKACAIEALQKRQSSTLKVVLAINAVMFGVELAAGLMASSTALLSDSLDNLGVTVSACTRSHAGRVIRLWLRYSRAG